MQYKTKQRDDIVEYLETLGDKPFSADDIILHFLQIKPKVSKATIYRTLDALENSGFVKKYFVDPKDPASYQVVSQQEHCEQHLHTVCTECGKLFHIDCHVYESLVQHFKQEHHFVVDIQKTIIYGLCDSCQQHHHQI